MKRPWKHEYGFIVDADDHNLARLTTINPYVGPLMASAPDLLVALEILKAAIIKDNRPVNQIPYTAEALQIVDMYIAKAKGSK